MSNNGRISPLSLLLVLALPARAQIDYFQHEIDYWNERPAQTSPSAPVAPPDAPKAEGVSEGSNSLRPAGSFDWKPYLDPKHTEFFKEGDYTPPEPFMEIVRNPSDENLKRWFAYIDKRNQLASRLQQRMNEYLGRSAAAAALPASLRESVAALPAATEEQKRYRFRFYFESTCPHCKRMFSTLADLQERGFLVEARQIDRGPVRNVPVATTPATPAEVKKQGIRTVPYLLIGDLREKAVYHLTGYQSVESIFQALRQRRFN